MGTVLYNLIVTPIETVIDLVFSVIYNVTSSPGIAIMAVSLVINFAVLPLYKRADDVQEAERLKQKEMKPWLDHIKKTFSGDERYMMQQAYYRETGYKPLYAVRGSLSLFFQIPFFMAAYNYLSTLDVLQNRSFLMLSNLSEPDGLIKAGTVAINLLPILMTGFNVISSVIYTKGLPLKDKLQTYILAAVFLVILYDSPSGLVFYWTLNQIFSMLKNVFLKLIKKPGMVLSVIFAVCGAGLMLLTVLKRGSMTSFRILAFSGVSAACFIPLAVYFIFRKIKEKNISLIRINSADKKAERVIFYFSSAALTVLLGAMIPLSVIKASPAEFITGDVTPFSFVINTVSIYAGFILVWVNVFYLLGSEKFRHILTYISACLTAVFLADFLFFAKKLGNISNLLYFDVNPSFGIKELLINLVCTAALTAAMLLVLKKKKSAAGALCRVLAVFTAASVAVSAFSVSSRLSSASDNSSSAAAPGESGTVFTLSKTGKNVVIIMLDRAIGAYIPYIMDEKPELKDTYDGFTYYPNIVSFGGFTNFAAPALFGGYEYTPTQMNKRTSEPLIEKSTEALKVLPSLFGKNGYDVTFVNPCYAGSYTDESDLTVFDDLENVTAVKVTASADGNELLTDTIRSLQKHNFIYYSLMKAVPTVLHNAVYYVYTKYNSKDVSAGNITDFIKQYAILENLKNYTGITGKDSCNLLIMENDTTHEPLLLQEPGYTPELKATRNKTNVRTVNGVTMKTDGRLQLEHYHSNMAAILSVGRWLDWLKEQGVYDNTRIIIVSDHGRTLDGQFDNMKINSEIDAEAYNPLMLVKDFGSHGFRTDDSFMTNADMPTLATDGIIDSPVNPFTGNAINSSEKNAHAQLITTSWLYDAKAVNNGNVYDTSDGAWWSVKDNILDPANWTRAGDGDK